MARPPPPRLRRVRPKRFAKAERHDDKRWNNTRNWVTLAAVVAITATLSGLAPSAQPPALSPADTKAIDGIFEDYDKPASPGSMLGVVADGSFVYTRGYGRANIEHDVAFTPQTVLTSARPPSNFLPPRSFFWWTPASCRSMTTCGSTSRKCRTMVRRGLL
jgi:hypothetical protein